MKKLLDVENKKIYDFIVKHSIVRLILFQVGDFFLFSSKNAVSTSFHSLISIWR